MSGALFKDEFDIEDYLRKLQKAGPSDSTKNTKNFYIQVFRQQGTQEQVQVNNEDEEFDGRDYAEQEVDRIQKTINKFVKGKLGPDTQIIKELDFIQSARLPVEMAAEIDVQKRKQMEMLFPVLKKYNSLCFKARRSTARRMLIFPANTSYMAYMKDMRKLIEGSSNIYREELGSRVRFNFRGKFVLRINNEVYQNFEVSIKDSLKKYNVVCQERLTIEKVDLSLVSTMNDSDDLRKCVAEIMDLIVEDYLNLEAEIEDFNNYQLTCSHGRNFLDYVNQCFIGKVHVRYDEIVGKLVINGIRKQKKVVVDYIKTW